MKNLIILILGSALFIGCDKETNEEFDILSDNSCSSSAESFRNCVEQQQNQTALRLQAGERCFSSVEEYLNEIYGVIQNVNNLTIENFSASSNDRCSDSSRNNRNLDCFPSQRIRLEHLMWASYNERNSQWTYSERRVEDFGLEPFFTENLYTTPDGLCVKREGTLSRPARNFCSLEQYEFRLRNVHSYYSRKEGLNFLIRNKCGRLTRFNFVYEDPTSIQEDLKYLVYFPAHEDYMHLTYLHVPADLFRIIDALPSSWMAGRMNPNQAINYVDSGYDFGQVNRRQRR